MEREIHITAARKRRFDEITESGGPFLAKDLYKDVLSDVSYEFCKGKNGSDHILLKEPLSEEKEARLREIWEATMPPAPHADAIRKGRR